MLRSMTGFGRSIIQEAEWSLSFEVKSVNSRYLDLKWRTPVFLRGLENDWERVTREYASRGRVEISLNLQVMRADILGVALNEVLARAMLDQLDALAKGMGREYAPDFNRLLTISSLWQEAQAEPDPRLAESLVRGLRVALEDWNRSRAAEGQALQVDLAARVERLVGLRLEIAARIPRVREEKIETLRSRVQTLLAGAGTELSEERLHQEIVLLSDRLDVSEELTRLSSHLDRLAKELRQTGDVGKKLDFLLQEVFREINTCGNKAQDVEISRLVVEFKTELEKCREQVQNIE